MVMYNIMYSCILPHSIAISRESIDGEDVKQKIFE